MNDPQTEQITITVDRVTAERFRAADEDARAKVSGAIKNTLLDAERATRRGAAEAFLSAVERANALARERGMTAEDAAAEEREALDSL